MADKLGLNKEDFPTYKDYKKEYNRLYRQTDAYKEAQRKYKQSKKGKLSIERWNQSEKRKLVQQRHNQTDKGKLTIKKSQQKYFLSEKGKLAQKKWRQSEKGKKADNIQKSKRRAAIKRATPPWSDTKAIKEFYDNTPKGKTVHHEYALQG